MLNYEHELTYTADIKNILNCLQELENKFFAGIPSKEVNKFSIEIVLVPFLDRKEKLTAKYVEKSDEFKLKYKIKDRFFEGDFPVYKESTKKKFGGLIYNGFSTNSVYIKEAMKKIIDGYKITVHSITPVSCIPEISFSEPIYYIEFESNHSDKINELLNNDAFHEIILQNGLQTITYEQNKINVCKTATMFLNFKEKSELCDFLKSIRNNLLKQRKL